MWFNTGAKHIDWIPLAPNYFAVDGTVSDTKNYKLPTKVLGTAVKIEQLFRPKQHIGRPQVRTKLVMIIT